MEYDYPHFLKESIAINILLSCRFVSLPVKENIAYRVDLNNPLKKT
jgi:hypothetical protein